MLEYRDSIKIPKLRQTWMRSLANKLGRLAQGIREIKGTKTIYFIDKSEIPKDKLKQVTYARIVVDYMGRKGREPHPPRRYLARAWPRRRGPR